MFDFYLVYRSDQDLKSWLPIECDEEHVAIAHDGLVRVVSSIIWSSSDPPPPRRRSQALERQQVHQLSHVLRGEAPSQPLGSINISLFELKCTSIWHI
jgi:hypothetical protein